MSVLPERAMGNDSLEEKLNQPKKVEIDGQKVEQYDLSDVIEFDRYLESKMAVKRRGSGLRISKLEASGA